MPVTISLFSISTTSWIPVFMLPYWTWYDFLVSFSKSFPPIWSFRSKISRQGLRSELGNCYCKNVVILLELPVSYLGYSWMENDVPSFPLTSLSLAMLVSSHLKAEQRCTLPFQLSSWALSAPLMLFKKRFKRNVRLKRTFFLLVSSKCLLDTRNYFCHDHH